MTTPQPKLQHFLCMAALALVAWAPAASSQSPTTVYEDPDVPPQAMDYDAENKLFVAHPGWLNDNLIHYYKFRMYVPPNYNPASASDVPIVPLYLPTTDGTLSGVPDEQFPILRYHTGAGSNWDPNYSDFVHVVFVTVGDEYTPNSHRSYADLVAGGYPMTESDILANVPVVPFGSRLQDPAKMHLSHDDPNVAAPIGPWMAWFDGQPVQTFAFETTDGDFAAYINAKTRPGAAGQPGSGYEATVAPSMGTTRTVSAIPIWHINQIFTGVTPGVNNGGPALMGQRNVIGLDRLDPGYSPLWQVFWVKQVPPGYQADQASHPAQFTEANGFAVAQTPMFVNCPDIGPHGGGATNTKKAASFEIEPFLAETEVIRLEGSLIMRGGKDVSLHLGDQVLGSQKTGMMGAFKFEVSEDQLQPGENVLRVVYDSPNDGPHSTGDVVATYSVMTERDAPVPGIGLPALLAVLLVGVVASLRRK